MSFTDKIFERATIRGIADYLLYGLAPREDDRSYEERLDEPYERFEKAVAKYDKNLDSELLDLSNEVTNETACVYTEIGIQAGMLIAADMLKNISMKKCEKDTKNKENEIVNKANELLIESLYTEWLERTTQEDLREDKRYREIDEETKQKIKDIDNIELKQGEWETIDRALSCINERSAEYGRLAYQQGFRDAMNLTKK